jgi:hypothetical protein
VGAEAWFASTTRTDINDAVCTRPLLQARDPGNHLIDRLLPMMLTRPSPLSVYAACRFASSWPGSRHECARRAASKRRASTVQQLQKPAEKEEGQAAREETGAAGGQQD